MERRTGLHWIRLKKEATGTQFTVDRLQEGNKYEFRVIAINKAGQSKPSEPSLQITAKDPWKKPGAPGQPEITSTEKTAMALEWSAPSDDGGAAIDGYIVEYKMEGAFKWKTATPVPVAQRRFTIENLTEDMSYEYRVAACNAAGVGPFSSNSSMAKAFVPLGEYPFRV